MSLNIYQETGDKDYLDMAQFAGDRLMQLLTEIDEGTGLAHGASGYAWALGSLGKVTGKKIYKDKTEKFFYMKIHFTIQPQAIGTRLQLPKIRNEKEFTGVTERRALPYPD